MKPFYANSPSPKFYIGPLSLKFIRGMGSADRAFYGISKDEWRRAHLSTKTRSTHSTEGMFWGLV